MTDPITAANLPHWTPENGGYLPHDGKGVPADWDNSRPFAETALDKDGMTRAPSAGSEDWLWHGNPCYGDHIIAYLAKPAECICDMDAIAEKLCPRCTPREVVQEAVGEVCTPSTADLIRELREVAPYDAGEAVQFVDDMTRAVAGIDAIIDKTRQRIADAFTGDKATPSLEAALQLVRDAGYEPVKRMTQAEWFAFPFTGKWSDYPKGLQFSVLRTLNLIAPEDGEKG